METCPYYDQNYKQCNISGTYQYGDEKDRYCLSSDNWRRCPNYDRCSYEYKVTKKLRHNPDL